MLSTETAVENLILWWNRPSNYLALTNFGHVTKTHRRNGHIFHWECTDTKGNTEYMNNTLLHLQSISIRLCLEVINTAFLRCCMQALAAVVIPVQSQSDCCLNDTTPSSFRFYIASLSSATTNNGRQVHWSTRYCPAKDRSPSDRIRGPHWTLFAWNDFERRYTVMWYIFETLHSPVFTETVSPISATGIPWTATFVYTYLWCRWRRHCRSSSACWGKTRAVKKHWQQREHRGRRRCHQKEETAKRQQQC